MTQLDPIFISVKEAARILGVSVWTVYRHLDQHIIESRYQGRRRVVVLASLREYADALPATPGDVA